MKDLKKILDEAVSDNTRNKVLSPYRRAAKAGMTDKAAGYVGLLEILLDELSDSSKMDDKEFKQKVERYGARSKLVSSYVKKEQLPLDSDDMEAEIEAAGEPEGEESESKPMSMKSVLPSDEPDITGLTAKSPGGPPPPLPKKDKRMPPEKPPSLPSLKTVAKGDEPKPEPEAKKKSELGLADLPPEDLAKLKDLFKQASKELDKPLRHLKMKKVDVGPVSGMQDWSVGQTVTVGAVQGFVVSGGTARGGWVLSRKGKEYLFVPSKGPKVDRGLYHIDDPKVSHLR